MLFFSIVIPLTLGAITGLIISISSSLFYTSPLSFYSYETKVYGLISLGYLFGAAGSFLGLYAGIRTTGTSNARAICIVLIMVSSYTGVVVGVLSGFLVKGASFAEINAYLSSSSLVFLVSTSNTAITVAIASIGGYLVSVLRNALLVSTNKAC